MKTLRCLVVRHPARLALLLPLLWAAVGCSSKGSVHGTVTYKGKPLPGGTVTFVPPSGGTGGTSKIDPKDGTYRMEGLSTGVMKVTVQPYRGAAMGMFSSMPGSGAPAAPLPGAQPPGDKSDEGAVAVEIPQKYTDPKDSGITCDVKGGSQEFNINLE